MKIKSQIGTGRQSLPDQVVSTESGTNSGNLFTCSRDFLTFADIEVTSREDH